MPQPPHQYPLGLDPGAELHALLSETVGEGGRFGHRQHVHLAYLAVRRHGMPLAIDLVCGWIQRLTQYGQSPQKYHRTVSEAWVRLVALHAARIDAEAAAAGAAGEGGEAEAGFDRFVSAFPDLLDKRLLSRHYRSSVLASEAARHGWVEPDLVPFPMP